MKASPRQQRLLLDLQELDNVSARLRRRRKTLPEAAELDGLGAETAQVRERFMEAQRELDAQRAEIERIEADIATVRQRRERDEQLIAVSTSPKEAQALQGELDALARRTAELEDRELELMEVQETAEAAFREAEELLGGVEGRRRALEASIAESEQRIDAEIAANDEARAGLAAEIQGDLRELYEDTRGRTGIGAARLRGNVSEGSNMALAPAELSDIRAAAPDEIVFCPQSGAILVRMADEA